MRRIAIIISFGYFGTDKSLPGFLYDLEIVHKYCKDAKYDEIRVLTDIQSNSEPYTAYEERMRNNSSIYLHYSKQESLRSIFRRHINSEEDRGIQARFIYYSGHCSKNKLLLPDFSEMDSQRFREIAIQSSAEAFICMDCCECEGLNFPYRINNTDFTMLRFFNNDKCRWSLNPVTKVNNFTHCKAICITPSAKYGKSYSTENGSKFTKDLIELLSGYRLSRKAVSIVIFFDEIRKRTGVFSGSDYKHNPTMYLSRCILKEMPKWIYRKDDKYRVLIDPVLMSISLERLDDAKY